MTIDSKYLIQPPADHRRRKAKLGEIKSHNAHRKPLLVQQTRKYSEADILKMVTTMRPQKRPQ